MDTLSMISVQWPTTDAALVRRTVGAVRGARSPQACRLTVGAAELGNQRLRCSDSIVIMARDTADTLWPVALRKLTPSLVQSLSEEDFARLCRMVRRRARRRQPTDRHADDLVKRLKKRRFGVARLRKVNDLKRQNPLLPFAKYRDNRILNSFHPCRSKLWIEPIDRTKRDHFSLENLSFVDEPNPTMKILSDLAGGRLQQGGPLPRSLRRRRDADAE